MHKIEKFKEKNDIGAVNKNSYANVVKQKINHNDQGYRNGNNYQKQENYFHQSRNFPQWKNDDSQRNRDYNQYDETRNRNVNDDWNEKDDPNGNYYWKMMRGLMIMIKIKKYEEIINQIFEKESLR